jgi:hypothetical protein
VIREQENLRQSGSTCFTGMEKLTLLQRFCATGGFPGKHANTLVKELLKYRLLDIVALVYDVAMESNSKERGEVPFIDKIVHRFFSVTLLAGLKLYFSGPCNHG